MNYLLKRAKYLGSLIMKYYQGFGVYLHVSAVRIVPNVRRYIFRIDILPGTEVSAIFNHASDIQAALKLPMFCPFKTGVYICIAVSEFDIKENKLLKILRSPEFQSSPMQIPLALGYTMMGDIYLADLADLFHLIIAGPSGTGKSVALQCIIMSIIFRCPVNLARLILFDIGADSLSYFSNERHLYHPIVKDTETGIIVLESLVAEMDERIIIDENTRKRLPYIVCLIDEFDDTIGGIADKEDAKRFTASINSIIRRGRKAKIILILASHNPKSKNVKVNVEGIIPRITFQSSNHYNSSTAIGVSGAQNLPGGGTMLFKSQKEHTPIQLQGSFVTSAEIKGMIENAPEGGDIDMLKIKEVRGLDGLIVSDTTYNFSESQ